MRTFHVVAVVVTCLCPACLGAPFEAGESSAIETAGLPDGGSPPDALRAELLPDAAAADTATHNSAIAPEASSSSNDAAPDAQTATPDDVVKHDASPSQETSTASEASTTPEASTAPEASATPEASTCTILYCQGTSGCTISASNPASYSCAGSCQVGDLCTLHFAQYPNCTGVVLCAM